MTAQPNNPLVSDPGNVTEVYCDGPVNVRTGPVSSLTFTTLRPRNLAFR